MMTACGAPSVPSPSAPPSPHHAIREHDLACGDIGAQTCIEACPPHLATRDRRACLVDLRFSADPEALPIARTIFARTGAVLGVESRPSVEGYPGQDVRMEAALPVGDHRRHLTWIDESFARYDAVLDALAERAEQPVTFERYPDALVFYRTGQPLYPSAYTLEGVVSYNLDGPLHGSPRDVLETLFHELFHVNDHRRGGWSAKALRPIFDAIVARCGHDHGCYEEYAPHDTVVADGTFYAFDARTRDVKEYAAELALRYFVEHEALLFPEEGKEKPAFKCKNETNARAWKLLADEFFGGVDLTRCD